MYMFVRSKKLKSKEFKIYSGDFQTNRVVKIIPSDLSLLEFLFRLLHAYTFVATRSDRRVFGLFGYSRIDHITSCSCLKQLKQYRGLSSGKILFKCCIMRLMRKSSMNGQFSIAMFPLPEGNFQKTVTVCGIFTTIFTTIFTLHADDLSTVSIAAQLCDPFLI